MFERFFRGFHIVNATEIIFYKCLTDCILFAHYFILFSPAATSRGVGVRCCLTSLGNRSLRSWLKGSRSSQDEERQQTHPCPRGLEKKGGEGKIMVPPVSQSLLPELHINTEKPKKRGISSLNSVQESVKRLLGGLPGKDLQVNLKVQSAQREGYTKVRLSAPSGGVSESTVPRPHLNKWSRLQGGQRAGEGLPGHKGHWESTTPGKGSTISPGPSQVAQDQITKYTNHRHQHVGQQGPGNGRSPRKLTRPPSPGRPPPCHSPCHQAADSLVIYYLLLTDIL